MNHTVALTDRVPGSERARVDGNPGSVESDSFAGYQFPPEVISHRQVAVLAQEHRNEGCVRAPFR